MLIDATLLDFDPERREYVQELSTLQAHQHRTAGPCSVGPVRLNLGTLRAQMPLELTLRNCPEPGQHRSFVLDQVDRSGGDIAGWRFKEAPGPNRGARPLSVLLIND